VLAERLRSAAARGDVVGADQSPCTHRPAGRLAGRTSDGRYTHHEPSSRTPVCTTRLQGPCSRVVWTGARVLTGCVDKALSCIAFCQHGPRTRYDTIPKKNRSNKDLRQHFFTERIINIWNSLDNQTVMASSLNKFKWKIRKDGSTTGLMSRNPRANLAAACEAPSGE